jgi:hypothetical protein
MLHKAAPQQLSSCTTKRQVILGEFGEKRLTYVNQTPHQAGRRQSQKRVSDAQKPNAAALRMPMEINEFNVLRLTLIVTRRGSGAASSGSARMTAAVRA